MARYELFVKGKVCVDLCEDDCTSVAVGDTITVSVSEDFTGENVLHICDGE